MYLITFKTQMGSFSILSRQVQGKVDHYPSSNSFQKDLCSPKTFTTATNSHSIAFAVVKFTYRASVV
jgi:hypothetical protein